MCARARLREGKIRDCFMQIGASVECLLVCVSLAHDEMLDLTEKNIIVGEVR